MEPNWPTFLPTVLHVIQYLDHCEPIALCRSSVTDGIPAALNEQVDRTVFRTTIVGHIVNVTSTAPDYCVVRIDGGASQTANFAYEFRWQLKALHSFLLRDAHFDIPDTWCSDMALDGSGGTFIEVTVPAIIASTLHAGDWVIMLANIHKTRNATDGTCLAVNASHARSLLLHNTIDKHSISCGSPGGGHPPLAAQRYRTLAERGTRVASASGAAAALIHSPSIHATLDRSLYTSST
ncbi:hypothetical protein C8J57DRAFT_1506073 [Mycena rebaudengoi]|nr:hypothetical protein C8J57DRAFT_1506073 [Mycena rebaudengoi]